MKKNIIAVCALLALNASAQYPQTSASTAAGNAENVARVLLKSKAANYRGYVGYDLTPAGQGKGSDVWMSFTADKDLKICTLIVNGTNIALEAPIVGILVPTNGSVYNFDVWVSQITSQGEERAGGEFYRPEFKLGDLIEVVLRVPNLAVYQKYTPPNDVQANNLSVRAADPSDYLWGEYVNGNLQIWMDAQSGPTKYIIFDRITGKNVGSGTVDPFEPGTIDNETPINVSYDGNIIEADLGNYYANQQYFQTLQFDSPVQTANGVVWGKVFTLDLGGKMIGVGVDPYDAGMTRDDVEVHVKKWMAEGTLPEAALSYSTESLAWFSNETNLGKVIIEIVPKVKVPYGFKFSVILSNFKFGTRG
jgi:hypothetical protein